MRIPPFAFLTTTVGAARSEGATGTKIPRSSRCFSFWSKRGWAVYSTERFGWKIDWLPFPVAEWPDIWCSDQCPPKKLREAVSPVYLYAAETSECKMCQSASWWSPVLPASKYQAGWHRILRCTTASISVCRCSRVQLKADWMSLCQMRQTSCERRRLKDGLQQGRLSKRLRGR